MNARNRIISVMLVLGLAVGLTAPRALASTPSQQLKAQRVKYAKLQGQLAKVKKADAATIAMLNGQVATLTAKVTAQASGGLAAVLAGNPDDMWAAVNAIWAAFPKMPSDQFCGYDHDNFVTTSGGLTSTTLKFSLYPCATP